MTEGIEDHRDPQPRSRISAIRLESDSRGVSPDDGVATGWRASDKGALGISFLEFRELQDALVRRERIERAGGVSNDDPPVLARLGVSAA